MEKRSFQSKLSSLHKKEQGNILANDYVPNKIRVIYFAILTIGSKNTDFLANLLAQKSRIPAQAFSGG
jgi:hypothetical protein